MKTTFKTLADASVAIAHAGRLAGLEVKEFTPDEDGNVTVVLGEPGPDGMVMEWRLTAIHRGLVLPDRVQVQGDTTYTNARGTRCTLSRLGVEDAFSSDYDDSFDPAAIIKEQRERVQKRIEFSKTTIPLPAPFGAWALAPARLEQIKADLAAGRRVELRPSGFGTGYSLTTRATRERYAVRVIDPACLTFFGVERLSYTTIDCD